MNRIATSIPIFGDVLKTAQYAISALPYPLSNSLMPLHGVLHFLFVSPHLNTRLGMPHFQSRRLFTAQSSKPIPTGTPGMPHIL